MAGATNMLGFRATIPSGGGTPPPGGGGGGGGDVPPGGGGTNPTLYAAISPTTVSGYCWDVGTAVTDTACVCYPSGGVPPYTYAWEYVSGLTTVYATSPTAYATTFYSYMPLGSTHGANYRCTVTDAAAQVVHTNEVTINLDSLDSGHGGGIIP